MKQKIFPSLMPKNQKQLGRDLLHLRGVVKHLHLDVVDGKFAKNKVLMFPFKLKKEFFYSAHLMVKNQEQWIKKHGRKIDLVIPHLEELKDVDSYIKERKRKKSKVALAVLPETRLKKIKPYLKELDYILLLTVHPGFYGSKYLVRNYRIKRIKKINPKIKIIVDGGMNPKTIRNAAKAGADYFVSGSYTTKSDDPRQSIKNLLEAIKR